MCSSYDWAIGFVFISMAGLSHGLWFISMTGLVVVCVHQYDGLVMLVFICMTGLTWLVFSLTGLVMALFISMTD